MSQTHRHLHNYNSETFTVPNTYRRASIKCALLVSNHRPVVYNADALTAELGAYLDPYGAHFFLRALFHSCEDPISPGPSIPLRRNPVGPEFT